MNPFEIGMILILSWWMCFFVALPIGVKSQAETGEVIMGTESGAPIKPNLKPKIFGATIGAVIFTSAMYLYMTFG